MSEPTDLSLNSEVELSILYEIASAAKRADSIEKVGDLALDKATRLLGAEIALFYLYNSADQQLHAQAARGVRLKKMLPHFPLAADAAAAFREIQNWSTGSTNYQGVDPLAGQYPIQAALSLPIKHDAALLGWLYVARLKRTSFTPGELSLYGVLADQVAAALETTLAWERLRQQQADLAAANQRLEQVLAEMTTAYQQQERLMETVRALSTPVLPIDQDILLVPIIGHIDDRRALLIKEQLLEAISRYQASIVLLDITGIAEVDQLVIQSLMQTTRAAQLLGASVIMCGISPQLAQVMVEYDLHLSIPIARSLKKAMKLAGIIVRQ